MTRQDGCALRSGADPEFGYRGLNHEAEPEGDAEEIVRGQVGEATGGEEDADDGADESDGHADGEGAEHPLAVLCDLAAADGDETPDQAEEE